MPIAAELPDASEGDVAGDPRRNAGDPEVEGNSWLRVETQSPEPSSEHQLRNAGKTERHHRVASPDYCMIQLFLLSPL